MRGSAVYDNVKIPFELNTNDVKERHCKDTHYI